jgi:23S rRNA pseudouridine2605 synthase
MKIRLNRFLAECGIASRRKSEEFINEGRVQINGKVIIELAHFIDTDKDKISLDGELIKPQRKVYYLLNKPKGFITSTSDDKGRKTVLDLIDTKEKIFPVGRLDYDTTGVLLLTNDGDFTNYFTHPGNKIPRIYLAKLDQPLKEEDKLKLLKGLFVDGRKSKFEKISFQVRNQYQKVIVETIEGRNHFVKNMFRAVGYYVDDLHRESFGVFNVKGIPKGSYRIVTYQEIKKVYENHSK